MAEVKDLPGWPSKRLVQDVKRTLWSYVRSRPQVHDEVWRLAWEWAAREADHSLLYQFGKSRRKRWPPASEIASRFLMLSLLRMKGSCQLRLGLRAKEFIPHAVAKFMSDEAKLIGIQNVREDFGIETAMPALTEEKTP